VVDLASVARDALNLAQPRWRDFAQERGIPLHVARELAPAPAMGNEAELREALLNLLLNAVQAMPIGGTLTARTGMEDGHPYAHVIDTGVGMSEAVRRRCLEPFFTTRGAEGTGLGLATVYGTVTRHGGEMIVESAPGRGSTVGFRLRAADSAPLPSTPAPVAQGRAGRLLVVEDDPLVCEVVRSQLAMAGYEVRTAADGAEALAQLATERPDLVITDQGLPHMPGTELAAQIEQQCPKLSVLVLTGWGEQTPERVRSDNVRAILTKPVTGEALVQAVEEALNGKWRPIPKPSS
jgi:CheY-like chemotaxis protein